MFDASPRPLTYRRPAEQVLGGLAALAGEDRRRLVGRGPSARVAVLAEIVERSQAELVRATGLMGRSLGVGRGRCRVPGRLARRTSRAPQRHAADRWCAPPAWPAATSAPPKRSPPVTSPVTTSTCWPRRRAAAKPCTPNTKTCSSTPPPTLRRRRLPQDRRDLARPRRRRTRATPKHSPRSSTPTSTRQRRSVAASSCTPSSTPKAARPCSPRSTPAASPTRGIDGLASAVAVGTARRRARRDGRRNHSTGTSTGGAHRSASTSSSTSAPSAASTAADLTQIRCELAGVGPDPAETARRLCCDATVGRVLMRGPSEILDLGRRTRSSPRATPRPRAPRRRLRLPRLRPAPPVDRRPPPRPLGPRRTHRPRTTSALLCRRHHVAVHEGSWQLARDPATGEWTAERSTPVTPSDPSACQSTSPWACLTRSSAKRASWIGVRSGKRRSTMPPSTVRHWPVVHEDSGPAK